MKQLLCLIAITLSLLSCKKISNPIEVRCYTCDFFYPSGTIGVTPLPNPIDTCMLSPDLPLHYDVIGQPLNSHCVQH